MPYANSKGADQPAHPCSLISTFVVRSLDSIIPILDTSGISRLQQLASVAEQAGSSLTWSKIPKTGFLMTWLILCECTLKFISILSENVYNRRVHISKISRTLLEKVKYILNRHRRTQTIYSTNFMIVNNIPVM